MGHLWALRIRAYGMPRERASKRPGLTIPLTYSDTE